MPTYATGDGHNSDFTILIADDDPYITELIRLYLSNKGYTLLSCASGSEVLPLIRSSRIHLLLLDIMLPGLDGWEVCRSLREMSDMPILMLTAKGESEDKALGFGLGADDYMVKPFDPNELVMRVGSLLRRAYTYTQTRRQMAAPAPLQFDTMRIDTAAHTVTIQQELIELTPREYKLLLTFANHPNQVLDRQQLLDLVWGGDYFGEDRVVDVTVKRLRHKLSEESGYWSIETVRGTGYKFKVGG
ncbi:response regulator transcription factor [Paenibacillus rigui]|uniref:DNA-binding response regulator n=1 Tax=Paenibacillus rigui TaxID=554312 RepID=A0A229UPN6_9BACL|nr:response regulator transcription factor [Paenibacillus rigui]OXM85175.1 DNA-binding response regulator [Paenibacillus rigui]